MHKVRNGGCQVRLDEIGDAAVKVGGGVIRVQMDRLVVVLDRATVVALPLVGDPAVVVVVCIIRVQANRFVEILNCTVVIILVYVGVAAVVVGSLNSDSGE